MMWVTPSRTTSIILASFQIPPPTAIWSVTHVMSMPDGAPAMLVVLRYSPFYREESAIYCGTAQFADLVLRYENVKAGA
jgi:hypothetical protein